MSQSTTSEDTTFSTASVPTFIVKVGTDAVENAIQSYTEQVDMKNKVSGGYKNKRPSNIIPIRLDSVIPPSQSPSHLSLSMSVWPTYEHCDQYSPSHTTGSACPSNIDISSPDDTDEHFDINCNDDLTPADFNNLFVPSSINKQDVITQKLKYSLEYLNTIYSNMKNTCLVRNISLIVNNRVDDLAITIIKFLVVKGGILNQRGNSCILACHRLMDYYKMPRLDVNGNTFEIPDNYPKLQALLCRMNPIWLLETIAVVIANGDGLQYTMAQDSYTIDIITYSIISMYLSSIHSKLYPLKIDSLIRPRRRSLSR
jgi:hypothetical protein